MTIMKIFTRYACLLGMPLIFMASCMHAPDHPKPDSDIPIIKRPNWWNFYKRGVAYSLRNDWSNAVHDFEVALGIREGAIYPHTDEKRRTKTYGLHFLNDYFPHRELGVSLYYMKRYDEAKEELETSLEMLPSSRAKLYLNKVREAQFSLIDVERADPIDIDMRIDDGPILTNKPYVRLKGYIQSPYYISRVAILDRPLFIELATTNYELDRKLSLKSGRHKLTLAVEDLARNRAVWERECIIDTLGPAVSFSPSASNPKEDATMMVIDNIALESISIDGTPVDMSKDLREYRRELPLKPARRIKIRVQDKAGNESIIETNTGDLLRASLHSQRIHPDNRLANRVDGSLGRHGLGMLFNTGGEIAADFQLAQLASPAITPAEADTMPPRFQLHPEIDEQTVVTTELYVLDIEVMDSGFIDSVSFRLNDAGETQSLRDRRLIRHRFTQVFELQPGDNSLTITARDFAGNTKTGTVTITRKMNAVWREDLRIAAQVMPPKKTDIEQVTNIDLYSLFLNELLRNPKRLNIIERDPETMQRMLLELQLAESKLADQVRAIRAGRLKTSDWLLEEYVNQWSGESNWDLVVNIVDVETSEYILTTDIHFTGFSRDHIQFQLSGLVDKLHQQLPALSATINGKMSKGLKIPLGKQDNIQPGMRFIFISAQEEDIDFADPMMWEDKWIQGYAKIVKDNISLIEIAPKEALDVINVEDLAVVR